MTESYFKILPILTLLMIFSCSQSDTFNEEEWKATTGERLMVGFLSGKTKRELMVKDLKANNLIIGRHYLQLQELLGLQRLSPDRTIQYLIAERYKWNVDPDQIIYLKVVFDSDSIAVNTYAYDANKLKEEQ